MKNAIVILINSTLPYTSEIEEMHLMSLPSVLPDT